MITACEIRKDGAWTAIGFIEAVAFRAKNPSERMRCPRCYGRVSPYVGGGAKPHFGHYTSHAGCKQVAPVIHPEPIL